ncbi:MAG: CPBP family intramembrane glutamic endopeptidase [Gammaproteobacteria bacterium]
MAAQARLAQRHFGGAKKARARSRRWLSEELVYRGIVPALLLGRVRRAGPIEGMPWVVILAPSAVFGIWHGLNYSNGKFGFDAMSALFPFIGSIPGGWLRFKTRGLLFPLLAHGLANLAFHIAGGGYM